MIRFDITPAEGDLLLAAIDRLQSERVMQARPRQERPSATSPLDQLERRLQAVLCAGVRDAGEEVR